MIKRVIVIGGGAAGLMAAGTAAENGANVLLFEKMATPARKIRITGKGRCNLSNSAELPDFIKHFGPGGRFLRQSFGQYFTGDLVNFFETRGLPVQYERGGRIFPRGNDAPAVARLMVDWVEQRGVELITSSPVDKILIKGGMVRGVLSRGKEITAESVILATGGKSYPRTGSTGDGYRLAKELGHTVEPQLPGLVSLKTDRLVVRGLAGLNLRNVNARLFIDGKRKGQEFGELTFTTKGLGGPIIITLSGMAVEAMQQGKKVKIHLDLKPALDDAKLDARLLRDFEQRRKEEMASVLRGLLPRPLIFHCLQAAGINAEQLAGTMSSKQRRNLRIWLKDLRFDIIGHGSWEEAIVTVGGVRTKEINPNTMESRLIKNLYIVGEVLDLQADTGGFNLQAAFSTGWVAGKAATV